MGPTACGKSTLAMELTKKFPFSIVSVDSALVYRGLNIGTAKPSSAELAAFPHDLIDIRDPNEIYSVGQFCIDVACVIKRIQSEGKIPLLVGGTMMYFHSLQFGLDVLPKADPKLRAQINAQASQLGWPAMHATLMAVNPERARQIHPNDAQRIQRALEIDCMLKNNPQQSLLEKAKKPYDNIINIMLLPRNRELLKQRIRQRFLQMVQSGLVEEVVALKQNFELHVDLPSMRTVGYQEVWQYLDGKIDMATMQERAIIATNQLAKRQLTWLRRWQEGVCFACEDPLLLNKVSEYLSSTFSL